MFQLSCLRALFSKGEESFDAEDEENFGNFFDRERELNVKEISKVNSVLMCMP